MVGLGSEVDRGKRVAHFAWAVAEVRRAADAEGAVAVVAPAFHLAVVEQGAARRGLERDRFGGAPRPEIDRKEVVAHLAGGIAAIVRVAVAELTRVVDAPAFELVVVEDGARVVGAAGDRLCGAAG